MGELFTHISLGLATAMSLDNLFYCFIGVLVGTVVGILPGLGPLATIALLLPLTFGMSPTSALIMLAGIFYGSQYGGSTTAILIKLPGEASAAVTAIDGYEMARKGRAGVALAMAALGSFFAGTVATLLIVLVAPPLAAFALRFGPPEYFSLVVLGLLFSVTLAHGSAIKALAMTFLGILLGTIGRDIYTGEYRFTFGLPLLEDGIELTGLAIAVFGLAEILRNLETPPERRPEIAPVNNLFPTRQDVRRARMPVVRGTLLGSILGVLPGAGAIIASFASYSWEKRLSPHKAEFGHGAIEGVAGPESANNAAAQTSFIPMLTLGVPGNAIMAVMLGALLIQGITPGPAFIRENPDLFWGVIASMWLGNLMLLVLNLPLIGIWVKILAIPYRHLVPIILGVCTIGTYSVGLHVSDLYIMAGIGLVGYLLLRWGCEPAPLVLGFVLGPLMEQYLRRSLIIARGDPTIFFQRPISAMLLLLALLAVVAMVSPRLRRKRAAIIVEGES